MSQQQNTQLLEEAVDHIDFWTGTQWAGRISRCVLQGDLEELRYLLNESTVTILAMDSHE